MFSIIRGEFIFIRGKQGEEEHRHAHMKIPYTNACFVLVVLDQENKTVESYSIRLCWRVKQRLQFCSSIFQSIMAIGDELLKDSGAWTNMSVSQQRSTAASLLDSMETTGLLAASTMDVGASNTTRKSNIGQLTSHPLPPPFVAQEGGTAQVAKMLDLRLRGCWFKIQFG